MTQVKHYAGMCYLSNNIYIEEQLEGRCGNKLSAIRNSFSFHLVHISLSADRNMGKDTLFLHSRDSCKTSLSQNDWQTNLMRSYFIPQPLKSMGLDWSNSTQNCTAHFLTTPYNGFESSSMLPSQDFVVVLFGTFSHGTLV